MPPTAELLTKPSPSLGTPGEARGEGALSPSPKASTTYSPTRLSIRACSLVTPFGDTESTWRRLIAADAITNHVKLPAPPHAAASRILHHAHSVAAELSPHLTHDAALVVGTSKGPVEDWMSDADRPDRAGGPDPTGLAEIAQHLASRLNLSGPRLTLSAACASGLHALIRAALLLESGHARQCLVVAAECSVHPLFLSTFQRLGVLAPPGHGCRPFDQTRAGFLMSESAAALILERADVREQGDASGNGYRLPRETRNPNPFSHTTPVHLDRYALAGDATHLTGSDPQARTLRHLLTQVIAGNAPDLIHAHGTGTLLNDEAELRALEACLPPNTSAAGGQSPALYSHKGALGHSLGAAGLVSVVLNCLMHQRGTVPPNPHTTRPLPAPRLMIAQHPLIRPIRRSLAIAAGFGGSMAAVSLIFPAN